MAGLLCERREADTVDFVAERFVVCKAVGLNAGGRRFEMGDELPPGTLNARAMAEVYDTPTRLIETMEWALADEGLLAAMMSRPAAEAEPVSPAPVVAGDGVPDKVRPGKGKNRQ